MKGVGTFRRLLVGIAAAIGLAGARPLSKQPDVDPVRRMEDENQSLAGRRKPKKRTKPTNMPFMLWGRAVDAYGEVVRQPRNSTNTPCPKPLSRKALRRICPNHPLLVKAKP